MPPQVLQREQWHGEARELGDLFRLEESRRHVLVVLYTHQFGWELRMEIAGELRQSNVCRTQDEVLTTAEPDADYLPERTCDVNR